MQFVPAPALAARHVVAIAIMKRIQGEKTLTKFAAELDMSKQYLSNVYNRHKEPSERLLEKLGLTRQTTYVRSPTAAKQEKKT